MRNLSLIVLLVACIGCAAMTQQKSMPAKGADTSEFKNLKVLPPNITHEELITTMRGFSRALGVHCDFCHVETKGADGKESHDFVSDAKPEKKAARTMLLMTRSINNEYLAKLGPDTDHAGCWTCHRGKEHPEQAPPAPAGPPAGAPKS